MIFDTMNANMIWMHSTMKLNVDEHDLFTVIWLDTKDIDIGYYLLHHMSKSKAGNSDEYSKAL